MVNELIEKYKEVRTPLLPILREIQKEKGYLTEEVLREVALGLNIPYSRVYGVSTFYTLLSTEPKGKHVIRVCENAPCHINGAPEIVNMLQDELDVQVGETTDDGLFTLELVSCLGLCGVAPAMMVDDECFGNLDRERLGEIISRYREKK